MDVFPASQKDLCTTDHYSKVTWGWICCLTCLWHGVPRFSPPDWIWSRKLWTCQTGWFGIICYPTTKHSDVHYQSSVVYKEVERSEVNLGVVFWDWINVNQGNNQHEERRKVLRVYFCVCLMPSLVKTDRMLASPLSSPIQCGYTRIIQSLLALQCSYSSYFTVSIHVNASTPPDLNPILWRHHLSTGPGPYRRHQEGGG